MALCNLCWGPNCAKSANPATDCNCPDFIAVINTARQANGVYNNTFRSLLPIGVRDLSDNVIDAARGVATTGLVIVEMGPTAQTLYNDGNQVNIAAVGAAPNMVDWFMRIDGTDADMLGDAVEIFENVPEARPVLLRRLKRLVVSATNQGQREQCKNAMLMCESFEEKAGKVIEKPKSASELEDKKYPLSRIYLYIVKGIMSGPLSIGGGGSSLERLTTGLFDKANGMLLQDFEKIKVINDANDFQEALREFLNVILIVGKNGGREAWKPIYDQVYSLLRIKSVPWCHSFFFQILKKLDLEKGSCNLGNFMSQYFQSFRVDFDAMWELQENGKPSSYDLGGGGEGSRSGDTKEIDWASKPQVTTAKSREGKDFADVTRAGAAGIIRTDNGDIAYCSRWQLRKRCNRGVKGGPNHGKCAYTHACSWCKDGTTSHRGADKKNGAWVCPNHGGGGGN